MRESGGKFSQMKITRTLDAKGLTCPMPIVRIKKTIDTINAGDILEVLVTDKGALNDVPLRVKSGGHTILEQKIEDDVIYFYIQKG